MDNFDCPGHKNGADQGYNTTTHHICGPVKEKIAAALREAKAQAFEEARARAQIEVNACTSQVKAAAPRDRRIHEAARGVAQVIVRWCGLAAEGCRAAQDAPANDLGTGASTPRGEEPSAVSQRNPSACLPSASDSASESLAVRVYGKGKKSAAQPSAEIEKKCMDCHHPIHEYGCETCFMGCWTPKPSRKEE